MALTVSKMIFAQSESANLIYNGESPLNNDVIGMNAEELLNRLKGYELVTHASGASELFHSRDVALLDYLEPQYKVCDDKVVTITIVGGTESRRENGFISKVTTTKGIGLGSSADEVLRAYDKAKSYPHWAFKGEDNFAQIYAKISDVLGFVFTIGRSGHVEQFELISNDVAEYENVCDKTLSTPEAIKRLWATDE